MYKTKEPRFRRATKYRPREQIGWRYKFWVYNPERQRNEPVPVDQLPERGLAFKTDEEAQAYCDLKSAEEDAIKVRIQKRVDWMSKFQDHDKLLADFVVKHKKSAPGSWDTDESWLRRYVFHFFLGIKQCPNVNNWSLYYDEFKTWLETTKPLKHRKDRLAYNSMNKAIKALNSFLEFNAKGSGASKPPVCPVFPAEMCNTKTADDIFEQDEVPLVQSALREICPISADLFVLNARSGLRISELFGISFPTLRKGNLIGRHLEKIHDKLKMYGLESYYGYVCLESQVVLDSIRAKYPFTDANGKTWEVGSVPRKPLKMRKDSPESYRYIPIWNHDVWKILALRRDVAKKELERQTFGADQKNYLLFDGVTPNKYRANLRKACARAKVRYHSPHDGGRHTFATWFYDVTYLDQFLGEVVLGHKDDKTRRRYGHMAELRGREAMAAQQDQEWFAEAD